MTPGDLLTWFLFAPAAIVLAAFAVFLISKLAAFGWHRGKQLAEKSQPKKEIDRGQRTP